MAMQGKNILLIITGGIAAYKSLDLIRRLRERGAAVNCILTKGGAEFITPLAVSALSGKPTYSELFSLKDEIEMGHIRLAREADLIIVAPATAEFMARLTRGGADDLASTTLLAANKPILLCPSMNKEMWANAATQDNVKILESRGLYRLGPDAGDLACGEVGDGRMAEADAILSWAEDFFTLKNRLKGKKILVTAGATRERIDPVRFISNFSSGKQGHAIAEALAIAGAEVHLVTASDLPIPANCTGYRVESAQDMLQACDKLLPLDAAICVAAVSDWQAQEMSAQKIKKQGAKSLSLELKPTPDILAHIGGAKNRRPQLVVGFAAESENMLPNAETKLKSKNCDWIVANDIGKNPGIMGGNDNEIILVDKNGAEPWEKMPKRQLAKRLAERIAKAIKG